MLPQNLMLIALILGVLFIMIKFMDKPFLSIIAEEIKGVSMRNDYMGKIIQVERCCSLTPRESEVFELLAYGKNAGSIEEELGIARNTVKTHIRNIYQKTGVSTHQELLAYVDRIDVEGGR